MISRGCVTISNDKHVTDCHIAVFWIMVDKEQVIINWTMAFHHDSMTVLWVHRHGGGIWKWVKIWMDLKIWYLKWGQWKWHFNIQHCPSQLHWRGLRRCVERDRGREIYLCTIPHELIHAMFIDILASPGRWSLSGVMSKLGSWHVSKCRVLPIMLISDHASEILIKLQVFFCQQKLSQDSRKILCLDKS